jgi:hypothetical protein
VRALRPFIAAFQGLVGTEALTIASQRASQTRYHEARREQH